MSFQAPVFLAGLALVPLLLAAAALARRRAQRYDIRLPSVPTLAAVAPAASRWRRRVPTALLCLALAGLAIALARPEATVAVPVERASVMLVTDASGSMRATDVAPDRLRAAQAAAGEFLDELPDPVRVGVVGFSDTAHTVTPPTDAREEARATIAGLTADGGTATGDALTSALDALEGETGERRDRPPAAVVLLSDGAATAGRDPVAAARAAGRAGVPVYTVALGTPEGAIEQPGGVTQPVPPDPETLAAVAEASGGQAFAVDDADGLDAVYERLGSEIGTKQERREVTAAFAAGGLLLLVGSLAASLRWTGRLP